MSAAELASLHSKATDLPARPDTAHAGAGGPGVGPPLLIGGESPKQTQAGKLRPITGDFTGDVRPYQTEFPGYSDSIVLDRNGNPIIRPGVRCIKGQKVGIDWVSCVFEPREAWMYFFCSEVVEAEHEQNEELKVAGYVRGIVGWILGIDQGEAKNQKWKVYGHGLNGYRYAVGVPYGAGVVHVGHASGTCLVTISGQGALIAKPGWEFRLHQFLRDVHGWLTRVDMAFDDFEGEIFPVRKMRQEAMAGAFDRGGRPPKIELRGAWEQDDPNNSGLTLYVGSRMSGKLARIYEKGKQLGDESGRWVRAEVELHNSCYQLTLDMLLHPTQWFAAFYPAFEAIQYAGPRVELEYRERIAQHTVKHAFKWIRHQAGGTLAALRQLYTDAEILDGLVRPDAIPQGFLVADKSLSTALAPSVCPTDEPGFIRA